MALVTGNNDPIARALCELLGCPKHVRSITYRSAIGEASTVIVEFFADVDGKADPKLGALVKRYRLEEIAGG